MMRKMIFHSLLVILAALVSVTPVSAIPPLPSSFYGTVKVNGQNVPDGTVVRALIEGQAYATGYTQTYQGDSVFSLDVPGDDGSTTQIEGGTHQQAVSFEVGGVLATQSGAWSSGTNIRLDLTVTSSTPINDPVNTPTPVPTQTPIPRATKRPARTATEEPPAGDEPAAPQPVNTAAAAGSQVNAPTSTSAGVVSEPARPPANPTAGKQPGAALAQAATQPAAANPGQPAAVSSTQASEQPGAQPAAQTEPVSSSRGWNTTLIVIAVPVFAALAWFLVRKNRSSH